MNEVFGVYKKKGASQCSAKKRLEVTAEKERGRKMKKEILDRTWNSIWFWRINYIIISILFWFLVYFLFTEVFPLLDKYAEIYELIKPYIQVMNNG